MQEPDESKNEIDAMLLKKFQELRAMADGYIELHQAGFHDLATLLGYLDKLRATDSSGAEWKVGYAVDEWFKFERNEWVADFPPFPRNLLTDPNEYAPRAGEVRDIMWKVKIRRHSLEGE